MTKAELADAIERVSTESLEASVVMALELQALRGADDVEQSVQLLTGIADRQAALVKGLADILGVLVEYLLEQSE
jgi:hypothetical protein